MIHVERSLAKIVVAEGVVGDKLEMHFPLAEFLGDLGDCRRVVFGVLFDINIKEDQLGVELADEFADLLGGNGEGGFDYH